MITFIKAAGFSFLILVGYHYINKPLGFSVAGSVATAIFAICLMSVYQAYEPDRKNWIGWSLIASGCLFLATFSSFSFVLLVPGCMIIMGYRLAELPIKLYSGGGDGGGDSFADFDGGE